MASSSPFTFSYGWNYDVFLSFRGEDTLMDFIGNLYHALIEKRIRTFFDDDLQELQQFTPALHMAIQKSRIAMIILSNNYAFSSFCLEELVTILDCFKEKGRLVLPIFYKVDPSDVRHQRGSFGEAFSMHEERFKDNMDKVNKWKMALHQLVNLPAFHFKQRDIYEHKFIGRIIKEVSSKIARIPLYIANYPVGLESRMLKVSSLLDIGSNDVVHMVGIYGIGGLGKTTLARAVYNLIADQFECLCFLANVRENSTKYGLVHLQEILLSKIIGDISIDLLNVDQGISLIKHRLRQRKVLLVLDDVDKIEQLHAIIGAPDWFGSGSRVIITTRDKHLLKIHGIERTYEVEELNEKEALELLSWNAFKTDKVDPSYVDILNHAASYASRLPLALEVIGSSLYGKGRKEWEAALDWYERIPHTCIQNILKVSYDSLDEDEKMVFLDIACCFRGYKVADVEDILCAHHGLSMKYSIEVLINKSLIKIDDDIVTLHDLIQDMGREIVRWESPEEPGKRSRLWFSEDVVHVLEENMGTSEIQILILDFPKDKVHSNGPEAEEVYWNGEGFKKMKNLKTLIIRNGRFSDGPKHLPDRLRVLKWSGYPSPSLPYDFHPKKLSILELPDSLLRTIETIQRFVSLTVLNFSYNDRITHIPDVSGLPNLEKLSFKHCENLIKIHESVGFLDKLRILDAVRCKKLRTFPPIRLISLEQLNLSYCSILESFPEILGKMENMTELHIMGCPIKELPFSIKNLTRLQKLELQLCGMLQLPISIVMLLELGLMDVSRCEGLWLSQQDKGEEMVSKSSNMECLILSYCNISDEFLPIGLTCFANVKDLNLSGNNFTILHACIQECHFLRNLKLDDCRLLQEIRGIPWELETLSAKGCTSLKDLDLTVLPAEECHSLRELILDDCLYLGEIRGVLQNLGHFSAKNCTSLTSWCKSMLMNQELVEAGNKMFFLPGTKIPEWFTLSTRGESISFWFRSKFPAISLCLVIGPVNEQPITVNFSPRVLINRNKVSLASDKVYKFKLATDHILLFDLQLLKFEDEVDALFSENEWNHVEVSCADYITSDEAPIKLVAKQSGIYVPKQTSSMENIRFNNPTYKKRKSDFFLTCESKTNLLLKEKHRLKGMGFSGTRFIQKQQHMAPSTLHVEHSKELLSSLPAEGVENMIWDPNSMNSAHLRGKTAAMLPWKTQTIRSSLPILTSTQTPPAESDKGLAPGPIPSVERPWEDVGGETSERLPEHEFHLAIMQNDPIVNEGGHCSDDVKRGAVPFSKHESEEYFSNTEGSDSDDPFDRVSKKLSVTRKQTTLSGVVSSEDASLTSVEGAIDALEQLMVKDLSEASSDPAMHSRLDHLLDLLSTSSHPKVTTEVKEAVVKFKTKALASFKEFQATVESVNKLKNFEKQRDRVQQETDSGKDQRKDIKDSIKKASLAIKAENSRKKELEAEIETLRKQLAMKESDLEQLVLNVKNQEETLETYLTTCDSLSEQARAPLKGADDLVAANIGVEGGSEATETKQNRLKSTWSTDLTSQFIKIKKILGLYE